MSSPSTVLFLLSTLSGRAWAAWPAESAWTAVTAGGVPLSDPADDQSTLAEGYHDLVGDSADPAVLWALDADNLYLRQRVNLDPCYSGSGCSLLNDSAFFEAWGFLLSTDGSTAAGVLAAYEGKELALLEGSGTDDWQDFWGDVVWSVNYAPSKGYVRITTASSRFDGSADSLIDMQVPLSALSSLLGSDYPSKLRITAATAKATAVADIRYFNGDLVGGSELSTALSDVVSLDADEDGLLSGEEAELGTDPDDADTDDDGLTDGEEVNDYGTDPLDCDSDDDGLPDGLEAGVTSPGPDTRTAAGCFTADRDPSTTTNPLSDDTDSGSLADGSEDLNADGQVDPWETDPNDPSDDVDADGDDIPDSLEDDCTLSGTDDDADGDGVPDIEEGRRDSDGDGSPDFCDEDDDGDTIPTIEEGDASVDTNNNSTPDYLDLDSDSDGRSDEVEGTGDEDCDGIRNFQDANDADGPCGPGSGGDDTGPGGEDSGQVGVFGFSGGSFTGGACSALPLGAAWMPALVGFLGVSRRRRRAAGTGQSRGRAGWLALLLPGSASAQELNAQLFQPSLDGRILTAVDDTVVGAQGVGGGATFNYADDPFIYRYDDESREEVSILGRVATTDVSAFYNLHPLRLGISMPLHLAPDGYGVDEAGGTLLGDVRLDLKGEALSRLEGPLGLGGSLKVTLPTGNGQAWLGAATPTFTGQVNASTGRDIVVAGNLGFQFAAEDVNQIVGNVTSGSRLTWGLGGAARLRDPLWLSAELTGQRLLASSGAAGATPLEGLLTARFMPPGLSSLVVAAGGGMGLSRGLGAPDFRAVASVGWVPGSSTPDRIPIIIEEIPDATGTATPNAGVPFPYVITVTSPDGQPIAAQLLIPDRDFSARLGPDGTVRGSLPAGAYEVVLSADGYARTHRVLKSDGGGGTVSLEVVMQPTRVTVGPGKLEVSERIFFELDSDVIKTESYSLLDEIGQVMTAHPEILLIEIQGHTDDQGTDAYNQSLSQRRAEAVRRYLVEIDKIASDRLVARGYGESQPLQPNTSETARAVNRRVEFVILRTDR